MDAGTVVSWGQSDLPSRVFAVHWVEMRIFQVKALSSYYSSVVETLRTMIDIFWKPVQPERKKRFWFEPF